MSQTTLNLIAITIFTLVMSSLLGPLLNIPAAVPAVAVFGILSVATVDTLGLQGRIGDLVVDWFARFSPEYRSRIVRHEAGHFLVAHLLGIPVVGYTLTAWEALQQGQAGKGGVRFDDRELDAQLQQGALTTQLIDRYCTLWMAGIAAETLAYGNAEGGADDRQKLNLLWFQIQRPANEIEQKGRWAILQAKTLLETHWQAYEALVHAMEAQASVGECYNAIEAHKANEVNKSDKA